MTRHDGQSAAFGARTPVASEARRQFYRAARFLTFRSNPKVDYLRFYPAVRTAAEFADLSARVKWYLGDHTLPLYVEGADRFALSASAAPYMDPELVVDPGWSRELPTGKPLHVFWHLTPRSLPSFVRHCRRADIADPFLWFVSDTGFSRLRDRYAAHQLGETAPAAQALFGHGGELADSAFVLATGPSAQLVDPTGVTDAVRITCNSAVRDRDLITAFKPTAIAFADPVFHYGPSKYAAAFRRDLSRTLEETDAVIVTIDQWASILLANVPAARGRMVVLRSGFGAPWHVPDSSDLSVRHTGNILTNVMLPTALALARHVRVAGCDGRQPQENYFWKHNRKTQYSDDLMKTVFDAHPAFFRDRDYGDYYEEHCRELESALAMGEQLGRSIEPVTPSWIPALVERGAPAFEAETPEPRS